MATEGGIDGCNHKEGRKVPLPSGGSGGMLPWKNLKSISSILGIKERAIDDCLKCRARCFQV